MAPRPAELGLLGFDHVDLRVANREKLQRFLVEQMGVDVLGEGTEHTFLLLGDQVLGLHDVKDGETAGGVDHIALRVEEWTGLRNRVTRARLEITEEKERDDSRSLFLKGPDGLKIELIWRPEPHNHRKCTMVPAPPTPMAEDADEEMAAPIPARGRRR